MGRWKELGLILFAWGLAALGMAAAALSAGRPLSVLWYPGLAAAGWLAVHFSLRRSQADQLLLPLSAVLCGIGLTLVARLRPELAARHFLNLLLGLAALWLASRRLPDYRALSRYKYSWMAAGLALLAGAAFFGRQVGGAHLALPLGLFSFQPSEPLKVAMVIFLAAYLSEKRGLLAFAAGRWGTISRVELRYLGPMAAVWALTMVLLTLQQDLGAALLFFGILLAMFFLAGTRRTYLVLGALLFALGAWGAYRTVPRVQARVEVWLNPWDQAQGKGYQLCQAMFALGFGGVSGAGLGGGFPNLMPAAHTDLVFPSLAEELGLAGGIGLLTLYLLLIWRGLRVALHGRDEFGRLLAAGLSCALALQTWVIVGGSTKLIPLTGITLPLVSYGGTSLVTNLLAIGLLINISGSCRAGMPLPASLETGIPSPPAHSASGGDTNVVGN